MSTTRYPSRVGGYAICHRGVFPVTSILSGINWLLIPNKAFWHFSYDAAFGDTFFGPWTRDLQSIINETILSPSRTNLKFNETGLPGKLPVTVEVRTVFSFSSVRSLGSIEY